LFLRENIRGKARISTSVNAGGPSPKAMVFSCNKLKNKRDIEMLRIILKSDFDIRKRYISGIINELLFNAFKDNCLSCAGALIDAGADINHDEGETTLISEAVNDLHVEHVKFILEKGGNAKHPTVEKAFNTKFFEFYPAEGVVPDIAQEDKDALDIIMIQLSSHGFKSIFDY
jgi:hypothetical protein